MAESYKSVAVKYARDVISGKKLAGKEVILACQRFLDDMKRPEFKIDVTAPDFIININQKVMVHKQGEDINGASLVGKPVILQPWQIFIVYNLIGFTIRQQAKDDTKKALYSYREKTAKRCLLHRLHLLYHSGKERAAQKFILHPHRLSRRVNRSRISFTH